MANKKRKTLQIKRPDPNQVQAKKKPLPKVKMDEKAATSAIDTDELTSMGPKTAKMSRPDETKAPGAKSGTTRIALPDEDKIRRARRANATQDLGAEDALPSAEQIEHAQNNATMPIMIDTESVEESATQRIPSGETGDEVDQTMQIDADALSTGNLDTQLMEQDGDAKGDQTMQINPDALATTNVEQDLQDADKVDGTSDQTLKIDEDELAEGMEAEKLSQADQPETKDQTMEIDPDALVTRNLEQDLSEPDTGGDKTMQIDPEALATGNVDEETLKEVQQMETMKMDTMQMDNLDEELAEADSEVTREELEESFNAQTMEMDASQLAGELAEGEDEERSQTMDLSKAQRPKTIMIKRPSREAAGANTPTVKAVRPDAATVRTARPVTATPSTPKEGTSRIDVPGEEEGKTKEGKTIKLRRPAGGPGRAAPSRVSRVASEAGLSLNEDGTVTASPKSEAQLGGGWLAVAILTCLISLGALWSVMALTQADWPMPGRMVNAENELIVPVN